MRKIPAKQQLYQIGIRLRMKLNRIQIDNVLHTGEYRLV